MSSDNKSKKSATLTPFLIVEDPDKAIKFYEDVLGARVDFRMDHEDGKLMHAALTIGDSEFMMTQTCDEMPTARDPLALKGTPVSLYVYVDDVDATYKKALAAGAQSAMEPMDMFYGDRTAMFRDPAGHMWSVAKHIEDVSEDEIRRRAKEMTKGKKAA